VAFEQKPVV
jgi:hypothetical protein